MEENILRGSFSLLPDCKVLYDITITRHNVMFKQRVAAGQKNQKFTSVLFENIIGSKMMESKVASNPRCYVQIIPLVKNKKGAREKQNFTFQVGDSQDKQDNMTIADTWARTIAWLVHNPDITEQELEEKDCFPPQKKLFIMINPKSGPGKSLQNFKASVEPLLQAANVKYATLITEHPGHCRTFSQTFNCQEWDGIVICSGDGLVYEYINGIMSREDWKKCLDIPIGILPTGSGNALAASILYAAGESLTSLLSAVYVMLKGCSHPMDMFYAETSKKQIYGFLSLTWGIISDVDIESEKYRALGGFRFTVGAIKRILKLRHYKGKFSYILGKKDGSVEQGLDATEANSSSDVSISTEDDSRQNEVIPAININGNTIKTSTPTGSLPSLNNDNLPASWKSIEGEFVTIGISSLSHLAMDMHSSPNSYFDDGLLNVQYVKKGVTKMKMLDLFTKFEKGEHLELPELEVLDVKAFRLDPDLEVLGNIAIDGELIGYERVQGEVLPSLANIIMIKKC